MKVVITKVIEKPRFVVVRRTLYEDFYRTSEDTQTLLETESEEEAEAFYEKTNPNGHLETIVLWELSPKSGKYLFRAIK